MGANAKFQKENVLLQAKYNITAYFYDILDYPWERTYKKWRPKLVEDLRGKVLEAGVGTGRNLAYYHENVELTGIELSARMLARAEKRAKKAKCRVRLVNEDATIMQSISSNQFDWVYSTFMCCVMPDEIQHLAIKQFCRVLKRGGRFRLLEIVYSKNARIRYKQKLFTPFVEKVYGARFDRKTLEHIEMSQDLRITNTSFLKDDTYLLIEGCRV
jgi:ubiquinone/menaquinone biosynthesis C-methylase UbiE